jgi:hypothetical protein
MALDMRIKTNVNGIGTVSQEPVDHFAQSLESPLIPSDAVKIGAAKARPSS